MPKLYIMIGESGSGKSTKANEILKEGLDAGRKIIRVNMDNIREMFFGKDSSWDIRLKSYNAKLVGNTEYQMALRGLTEGFDVIVDDINLSEKTQMKWENLVHELNYDGDGKIELEFVRMDTPMIECIRRDKSRSGREQVGRAVIERQFLTSGRASFQNKPTVIVDVDGTLANSDGVRSPYDESKVRNDKPYPVVVEWVRKLWFNGFQVIIVSGRHASCGKDTINWLDFHGVPFEHIFMRNSGDNRPDTVIKQEILDGMLKCGLKKENIKFVLDDRPKVCRMWKDNGLTVYPVRGQVEEF